MRKPSVKPSTLCRAEVLLFVASKIGKGSVTRRFLFSWIAALVGIFILSAGGAAGYCNHGFGYESEWVHTVNVLGVGTGIKIIADTTCLERYGAPNGVQGYHPTAPGWYANAEWYTDSTTTCPNPTSDPATRYVVAAHGDYDTTGSVFCKYCDPNNDD